MDRDQFLRMELRDEDIPGASLRGQEPSELKISELKRLSKHFIERQECDSARRDCLIYMAFSPIGRPPQHFEIKLTAPVGVITTRNFTVL